MFTSKSKQGYFRHLAQFFCDTPSLKLHPLSLNYFIRKFNLLLARVVFGRQVKLFKANKACDITTLPKSCINAPLGLCALELLVVVLKLLLFFAFLFT